MNIELRWVPCGLNDPAAIVLSPRGGAVVGLNVCSRWWKQQYREFSQTNTQGHGWSDWRDVPVPIQ